MPYLLHLFCFSFEEMEVFLIKQKDPIYFKTHHLKNRDIFIQNHDTEYYHISHLIKMNRSLLLMHFITKFPQLSQKCFVQLVCSNSLQTGPMHRNWSLGVSFRFAFIWNRPRPVSFLLYTCRNGCRTEHPTFYTCLSAPSWWHLNCSFMLHIPCKLPTNFPVKHPQDSTFSSFSPGPFGVYSRKFRSGSIINLYQSILLKLSF